MSNRSDRYNDTLIARESFTSEHLSDLSKLALHCEEVIRDIHGYMDMTNNKVNDYDNLASSSVDLAQTIRATHDKNPLAVGYNPWLLLINLADTLHSQAGPESDQSATNKAWETVWQTARQTATGREIVEGNPVIQRVLEQPTPPSYGDMCTQYYNSDPRYDGPILDFEHRKHVASKDVTAPLERPAQLKRPQRQAAKAAIKSFDRGNILQPAGVAA